MAMRDIGRLLIALALAGAIGWILGQVSGGIIVGMLLYIAWLHGNLYQMLRWLRDSKRFSPLWSILWQNHSIHWLHHCRW